VEVGVGSVLVCGHEGKELGDYLIIRSLNRNVIGEDKFEIVGHILIRLVQTEEHLRLYVQLILQTHIYSLPQRLLAETSDKEILDQVVQRQLHSGCALHFFIKNIP